MSDPARIPIEEKYEEYTEVIKKFSKEKIESRYDRLLKSAQEFIQGMGYEGKVVCNETMLMFAVLGYYSDIMRMKDFHGIERAHDVKILAYETSWLLKRRPLQLKDCTDQKYAFCNEQFAFSQVTLWFKKDDGEDGTKVLAHPDFRFFSNTLFYHLKYRDYDPKTLELMLVSFVAGRKYQHLLSTKSN